MEPIDQINAALAANGTGCSVAENIGGQTMTVYRGGQVWTVVARNTSSMTLTREIMASAQYASPTAAPVACERPGLGRTMAEAGAQGLGAGVGFGIGSALIGSIFD